MTHIGRSSTDADFHGLNAEQRRAWLLESAIRSIGPYIDYHSCVADRRTGEILWREGDDPAKRPVNPEQTFRRPRKDYGPGRLAGFLK